ncbi:MAG: hypothetical protein GF375_05815 [Candidatus Omnitrophica bacterium]|nr:hypothetical protein [Candidatus Omnitrophota bacterium]MBD3269491.1 hypothetical protein [Candidatus Omnitrophota bacterium]
MRIEERDGKFVITSFDEIEAYKIACNIEKEGIHFYKKIAEKSYDAGIREVLDFLIEEELKHLKFFENRLYDLRQDEDDYAENNDLIESLDLGIFQPYKSMDDLEKVLLQKSKALSLGIRVEQRSISFYKACKDKVSVPEVKEELENIIGEEEKHKEKLKNLLTKSN